MNLKNYKVFCREADNIPRATLLLTRQNVHDNLDRRLVLVHKNKHFFLIEKHSIIVDVLLSNVDFVDFCLYLFNSPDDIDKNGLVKIGMDNKTVELYGKSRKSYLNRYLQPDMCDLVFIQLKVQDTLIITPDSNSNFNFNSDNVLKNDTLVDFTITELSKMNEMIDKLSDINIHQEYINKDFRKLEESINKHKIFQITKGMSTKNIISNISGMLAIIAFLISILTSNDKAIKDATSNVINAIIEILE